jgi:hypothetical protein
MRVGSANHAGSHSRLAEPTGGAEYSEEVESFLRVMWSLCFWSPAALAKEALPKRPGALASNDSLVVPTLPASERGGGDKPCPPNVRSCPISDMRQRQGQACLRVAPPGDIVDSATAIITAIARSLSLQRPPSSIILGTRGLL